MNRDVALCRDVRGNRDLASSPRQVICPPASVSRGNRYPASGHCPAEDDICPRPKASPLTEGAPRPLQQRRRCPLHTTPRTKKRRQRLGETRPPSSSLYHPVPKRGDSAWAKHARPLAAYTASREPSSPPTLGVYEAAAPGRERPIVCTRRQHLGSSFRGELPLRGVGDSYRAFWGRYARRLEYGGNTRYEDAVTTAPRAAMAAVREAFAGGKRRLWMGGGAVVIPRRM